MRTPRCGMPDVLSDDISAKLSGNSVRRKRYVFQGQKWYTTNLTWSLESRQIRNLDYYSVENVLDRALNVWSNQSRITFRNLRSSAADILIYFERHDHGDGFSFDGQGKVLAHAFFPGPGRGGDAHFDLDEDWTVDAMVDRSKGGTSLFMVAAHEFGHSLGLSHSNVPGSLMYPYYQGSKSDFTLPDDDKDAIQILYGPKVEVTKPYRPPTYVTSPWTPSTRKQPYMPPHRTPPPPPPPTPPSHPHPPQPPATPKDPVYRPPPPYYPYRPPHPDKPTYHPGKPSYPDRVPYYPDRVPDSADKVPDTCDTSYDAISVLRNELFIFKDKYMWRLDDKGKIQSGYPCLISQIWSELPANFTHVDAVYERFNGDIIFFIGREIYTYKGQRLMRGYPKPLTTYGLPGWLDHIDAALVWGHNHKTYFYSGKSYWRFDEEIQKVELDYPRNISIWKGIGDNIDAAFRWKDGITYFFKGKGFWKFVDMNLRVSDRRQTSSAQYWMGCPKAPVDLRLAEDLGDDEENYEVQVDGVQRSLFSTYQYEILFVSLIVAIIVTISVIITVKRSSNSHSYIHPKRIKR
ncbi:matrix metalloproteinase-2-like isoform X2 [Planococcus citri]